MGGHFLGWGGGYGVVLGGGRAVMGLFGGTIVYYRVMGGSELEIMGDFGGGWGAINGVLGWGAVN